MQNSTTNTDKVLKEPLEHWAHDSAQQLFESRHQINSTKLHAWKRSINERLRIRTENIHRLQNDELELVNATRSTINPNASLEWLIGTQAHFSQFYFELQAKKRTEDTECWRDITNVLRDFLIAYESVSQSKARGRFLHDKG